MDFSLAGDFYAAPFPSDHRLDGVVDLSDYPNPLGALIVDQVVTLTHQRAHGFSASSAVHFAFDGPIDATSLPLPNEVSDAAFLVGIDPDSPDYLQRYPVSTSYLADPGPHGAPHFVTLLPVQGIPLRPKRRYAAVLTDQLRDAAGGPLSATDALVALRAGQSAGLSDSALESYTAALEALRQLGIEQRVVALSAFTTDDARAELHTLTDVARDVPLTTAAFQLVETFEDYCVYQSEVAMPVYQQGEPPYKEEGGAIVFDGDVPVLDHMEDARIFVTIPRGQTMPESGWPTAVMIRSGGGGDRPLIDRGTHAPGGETIEPGSGPARYFAGAGFAGFSVDGPHGGIRNVAGGDEQFLIFNVSNPAALRDNLRQSAMELALVPDLLASLTLDVSDCEGDTASFDLDWLALMGHSIGATIAPITLAIEPRFGAAILSGAGGSFIENVVHKKSPLAVKPLAELLLKYLGQGYELHEHDPFLSLLQWGGEAGDPPLYARELVGETSDPRQILMLQGIVDTYILPPIANATSLSVGLDLVGTPLDQDHPELAQFTPLSQLLPLVGRTQLSLPVADNRDGVTAVVVQHAEDGIEDGHEVVFQTPGPKHQYRCFLQTWRDAGTPVVPVAADDPFAPCR